ncbi:hypothetical protein BS78_06G289600 [Paspalum vaginatum]|nr:hypothetical protein BS78_06G289600 [Paspalum vaginatum]
MMDGFDNMHGTLVAVSGEHPDVPGSGTQFKHGALHCIELIEEALPEAVAWGRHSRVVLDFGCGVRCRQLRRLPVRQGRADHVVRAQGRSSTRCRCSSCWSTASIPRRLLRDGHQAAPLPRQRLRRHPLRAVPGALAHRRRTASSAPAAGLFVWYGRRRPSTEGPGGRRGLARDGGAHPVHVLGDAQEDEQHGGPDGHGYLQEADEQLNGCHDARARAEPPLCKASDDQDAAWNIILQACMHRMPTDPSSCGSRAVAGAVTRTAGDGALLAGRPPGGRLRQARARRLRRGPGALEEGRRQLVPRQHGHRLEERRPERHGHEAQPLHNSPPLLFPHPSVLFGADERRRALLFPPPYKPSGMGNRV